MRPRISLREAVFILQNLKHNSEEVKQKLDRLEFLKGEIWRIQKEIQKGNAYAIISEGYTTKKQELAQLESEASDLRRYIYVYEGLIAKFEVLSSGAKKKGRHKAKASSASIWLSMLPEKMEPKTTQNTQ